MTKSIGFVLSSSLKSPLPSTRIAVLNMIPYLESAGFGCKILFDPSKATETPDLTGLFCALRENNIDVVVFQKVRGPAVVDAARKITSMGIKTVFYVCDRVDADMASATDATIVISDFLKSLYSNDVSNKIHVVHDGIENPGCYKKSYENAGSKLRVVLVTSHKLDFLPIIKKIPSFVNVRIVGAYGIGIERFKQIRWGLQEKNLKEKIGYLKFIFSRNISCVPWSPSVVYRELIGADVGIIPIEQDGSGGQDSSVPMWKRKSENRLTLKMAVGLPVVCTPIPAYESIIENGKNGYFACSENEWIDYLSALRDSNLREKVGMSARASVIEKYSMEAQASKLVGVLDSLFI